MSKGKVRTIVRMEVSTHLGATMVVVVEHRSSQATNEYFVFVNGGWMGDGSHMHTHGTLYEAMEDATSEAFSIAVNNEL